jgi:hypothetical protein
VFDVAVIVVIHCLLPETPIELNIIHIRALMNNLINNTHKGTSVTIYTFTHNPIRLQHVSISFRSSSGSLYKLSIHKTDELSMVITTEESVKHNSNVVLNTLWGGGYMFRPLTGHLQAIR